MTAAQALIENPNPTATDVASLRSQRAALEIEPENAADVFAVGYRQLVATVVADQLVTREEEERLQLVRRALSLPAATAQKANIEGFMDGFAALVEDGVLTADEDVKVTSLRKSLGVPDSAIHEQLARAGELRRAREVREGGLSAVAIDIKLKKGETCYHVADVAEMKSKIVRTYVELGVRYTERELETVREGRLYFTSERLLLVAEGTTSIKLDAIMDATTETEEGQLVLALTVDRRKTPYYFGMAEPYLALAVVDALRSGAPRA
jgi:hypothetical protein